MLMESSVTYLSVGNAVLLNSSVQKVKTIIIIHMHGEKTSYHPPSPLIIIIQNKEELELQVKTLHGELQWCSGVLHMHNIYMSEQCWNGGE